MIWSCPLTTSYLKHSAIIDSEWINTDHKIVISDFSLNSFLFNISKQTINKWIKKKYAYITKNITEETWQSFKNDTENYTTSNQIDQDASLNIQ